MQAISKEKLDKVIELNRTYFRTPMGSDERDIVYAKLNKAEKNCGKEIYATGLLDIISSIVLNDIIPSGALNTKGHDTPNETIYKVYEALGYEVK